MKAVILAGGLGTRISEETDLKPKPMIEIGGKPILWHILKMYSNYGVNEFIICCGYKGYVIKEYFSNYFLHQSDVTFRMGDNKMEVHDGRAEPWDITLVDTGENAMTGGRLGAVANYLRGEDSFCFTYGDGVSDINIGESIKFHRSHGRKATLAAVHPTARFGALNIKGDVVEGFEEKPRGDGSMVNGGFFVLSKDVLSLISGPDCVWERGPLESLASSGELKAFVHGGFWQPMDTLRDKLYLEGLWSAGAAPWKSW
jgi:glucose-1-phosphate cytidylyltransferase